LITNCGAPFFEKANRLGFPKFLRVILSIANNPHRLDAALRRWLAARHFERCNYAAAAGQSRAPLP
jgi:hypothetical protein